MPNELVVSLKGNDNDDPWLVIHADSLAVLETGLDQVAASNLTAKIQDAQAQYRAQLAAARGLGANVVTTLPQPAAPAEPNVTSQPPATAGPTCVHGAMKQRFAKPGVTTWKSAWFCPAPKGDPSQCEPTGWVR